MVISLWRHNNGPWDNEESIAAIVLPYPEQWAVLAYKEVRAYGYHIRKTREYGYHIRKTKWYGYADHVGCIRVNFGRSASASCHLNVQIHKHILCLCISMFKWWNIHAIRNKNICHKHDMKGSYYSMQINFEWTNLHKILVSYIRLFCFPPQFTQNKTSACLWHLNGICKAFFNNMIF